MENWDLPQLLVGMYEEKMLKKDDKDRVTANQLYVTTLPICGLEST
jgi:hypothetical protein